MRWGLRCISHLPALLLPSMLPLLLLLGLHAVVTTWPLQSSHSGISCCPLPAHPQAPCSLHTHTHRLALT